MFPFLLFFAVTLPHTSYSDLVRHFDYDRSAPLEVKEISVVAREGAKVHDLTYASPRGGRVPAYLVVPDGQGPFAVILYGHWMMDGSPMKNRNEFLEEALVMARAGGMSLLIDTPLVRPGFAKDTNLLGGADQASRAAEQQVVDLRRGLDLMLARPDADPKRVAYVGHSFDAHVGAILAAVDKRLQLFVLMAGSYADEENTFNSTDPEILKIRQQLGEEKMRKYFREHEYDDPIYFLSHSSPAAVFLQFARGDGPESIGRTAYERFGEPKKIAFYDAEHSLNAAARRDRVDWLIERMKLKPVDEAELSRIPQLK